MFRNLWGKFYHSIRLLSKVKVTLPKLTGWWKSSGHTSQRFPNVVKFNNNNNISWAKMFILFIYEWWGRGKSLITLCHEQLQLVKKDRKINFSNFRSIFLLLKRGKKKSGYFDRNIENTNNISTFQEFSLL